MFNQSTLPVWYFKVSPLQALKVIVSKPKVVFNPIELAGSCARVLYGFSNKRCIVWIPDQFKIVFIFRDWRGCAPCN